MRFRLFLAACLLCVSAVSAARAPAPRLVAYFPFWASYSHGAMLSDAPVERLTHLIYAYADLRPDGTVQPGDRFADLVKIQPGGNGTLRQGNFSLIPGLRERNPQLKVMIAIGGWNWTRHLSDVAADPALRHRFVASTLAFFDRYGFDGIEIDWRFPVAGGHPDTVHRADDLANYQLLLQALRHGCATRPNGCQIAITLPPQAESRAAGDYRALTEAVDFVSLIGTDFHGAWSTRTGHKSPLHGAPGIAEAVQALVADGLPRDKLVPMLPAQGVSWIGVPALRQGLDQPHRGTPWGTWDNEKTGPSGIYTLEEIGRLARGGDFVRQWDDAAQAETLYSAQKAQLVSFESPRAFAAKLAFVDREALGGVGLWEVSSDSPGSAGLITQAYRHYHPWRATWLGLRDQTPFGLPWLAALFALVLAVSATAWRLRRKRRRAVQGELITRDEFAAILATLPDDLRLTAHMAQQVRTRSAARLPSAGIAHLQRIVGDSLALCAQLQPLADTVVARHLRPPGQELADLQRFTAQLSGERSLEGMLDAMLRFLADDERVCAAQRLEADAPPESDDGDDEVLLLSASRCEALVRHATLADQQLALRFNAPLSETEEIYFRSLCNQVVLVRRQLQTLARQPQLLSELYDVASRRDKLQFIRADRGYSGIHASDLPSPIHITLRLRALRLYFDDSQLVQVHRSYLVRPGAVEGIRRARGGVELLIGRHTVPVARPYLASLKQRFPQWFALHAACDS
ncbi:glycosyl hydrolase family 18 protein [Chitiniphilus eburneus]|nr:glycosyl hydrolase family 18 protein [Chitiniphilus eburneus]